MSDVQFDELTDVGTDDDIGDISDDGFCHIDDGSKLRSYCGKAMPIGADGFPCKPFAGEAICPSCGRPNCPTCVVMCDLNDRLEYGDA